MTYDTMCRKGKLAAVLNEQTIHTVYTAKRPSRILSSSLISKTLPAAVNSLFPSHVLIYRLRFGNSQCYDAYRCIKPNLEKASALFDSGEVLRQLRYAGMMETIRIRREGYALREDHASFYKRFHLLLNPEETATGEGISHLVQVISKRLDITDADWQIGHTKIFLRQELATKLETLAMLRVHVAARTIGRFGRFVAERRASKLLTAWGRLRLHMLKIYRERNAATSIQSAYRVMKEREQYKAMQIAAVKVQSFQRRNRAIAIADALRDPYSGMTFAELKALYTEESARLDEAAEKNDFQAAAEIEAKM